MNKSPAFQYYPDKFETHTQHLSDYAYRHFHRLLGWMWMHSPDKCSIKAEPEAVATVLAQPCERIAEALREITNEHMPLLRLKNGKWYNNGLRKEAEKQKQRRKQTSEAAKKRWGKSLDVMQTHSKRNAKTEQTVSPLSPSPSPSSKKNTWITPYYDLWIEIMGGKPNVGIMVKAMKDVHDRHGTDKCVAHLRHYLKNTDGQFVSLPRFCSTFSQWKPKQGAIAG